MRPLFTILLAIIIGQVVEAQILKDIISAKDKIGAITVDKLSTKPVTTSFKDIKKSDIINFQVPSGMEAQDIHGQPYANNEFTLQPGYYSSTFESFCIKAGTRSPSSGGGRFYSELKGPKADIVEYIIRAHQDREDITQREVQLLLWAIIAKTDFVKMSGPIKVTALKILSQDQIARLSTGALAEIGNKKMKKLAYKTPGVKQVLEAENKLRSMYYKGYATYEEYEAVAILAGVEDINPDYPATKWTKHEDGYMIRYNTQGYAKTTTEIYVPQEAGSIQFDAIGDIAAPASTNAQRILQTNIPYSAGNWAGPGTPRDNEQEVDECQEIIVPAIETIIQEQLVNQNIPGIAIGVVQGGDIVHLKGYGYKTYSEDYPITIDTDLRWASISKTITAVATLQLQEAGKLSVNDRANLHVRNWPSNTNTDRRANAVRLSHALSNTSGINHYKKGIPDTLDTKFQDPQGNWPSTENYQSQTDGFNAIDAVDAFNFSVLDFNPGDAFLYSTYGFSLVGAAVDAVSDNGYVQHVMDSIADPLKMTSLKVATESDWGVDYSDDSGIIDSKEDWGKEAVLPGGGWESNICDLAKFARAIKDGTLLNNQNALYTNVQPGNSTYRFGIRDNGARREHGGSHRNLRTLMAVYNQVGNDDVAIVIMIPAEYAGVSRGLIRSEIIRQMRGASLNNPPAIDSCNVSDKYGGLDSFHGVWRKTNKDVILRTGLRHDEFYHEYKQLRNQGYACMSFEPYIKENVLRWDGVFKKESGSRAIWRNFKYDDFLEKWREMSDDGYRLADLETYRVNGTQLWAGLFEKKSGKAAMYRNMSTGDFGDKRSELAADGYKLIDIEIDVKNNQPRWSGVWIGGADGKLNRNYTRQDFNDLITTRRSNGYKLLDIESYTINNQVKFAGVWEKSSDQELTSIFDFYCETTAAHDINSENNYELIDWERTVGKVLD